MSEALNPEAREKRLNELVAQSVVLLDRQYILTEHLIQTSSIVLQELELAIAEQRQGIENVLAVYNYVFLLIDHLVRYQKIAHMIPRLNKKDPAYRALDEGMGLLKDDIRHTIQHIDREVDNEDTGPLLGAVCWVSGQKQFIASFNDIGRQRSSPGIVFDTQEGKFLQDFCFIYHGKYYDLNKAIAGMRSFNGYISSIMQININGHQYNARADFFAVCVDLTNTLKQSVDK